MKVAACGIGALLVVALAGCATSGSVEPTPAPSASETATPTPTPVPDQSDPANWVIGFGTLGPLAVGSTIDAAGSALSTFTVTRQDACPSVPSIDRDGFPNLLAPEIDGVISQLAVFEYTPATTRWSTAAGITIGSTEADLLAAYPGITGDVGQYNQTYYSTTDGSGYFINFAIGNGVVGTIVTRDSPSIDGEYCG